jgi:hypothetical protein
LTVLPMLLLVPALLLQVSVAQAAGGSVLISAAQIARLPMSGTAWSSLKKFADASAGTPKIADQNSANDVHTLAQALVFARSGTTSYRSKVIATLHAVIGTESGGRTLALGRNLPGYVIAADLVHLATADPTFDRSRFRPWLRALLSKKMSDGKTLRQIHELRPNNWGTHAGAARAAIAVYLGDAAELARTATVFRGWLGDRSAYAGFDFGSDLSWQSDAAHPRAIDAAGGVKAFHATTVSLDGALPDEMRRGASFRWPPTHTDYPWEALQGAVLQAEILNHAGYPAWTWSGRALYRAARFLYVTAKWPAVGDDTWQPWLIDARTGATFARPATTRPGKNFGFADWLYRS